MQKRSVTNSCIWGELEIDIHLKSLAEPGDNILREIEHEQQSRAFENAAMEIYEIIELGIDMAQSHICKVYENVLIHDIRQELEAYV